jgi:DNA repair protein RadC
MLTDGIGENSALLIKLFNALKAETDAAGKHDQLILSDYFVVRDYLKKRFADSCNEEILILMLDHNFCLLDSCSFSGGRRSVSLNPVDLVYRILACRKVSKVILANNHPDKTPVASKSDINYTIHARRLLSEFGVALIDHYIICGEKVVSLLKNSEA